MHFDLTDLRLFVQLAEAGSMTAASKRAHLSVASISARLKALEENMAARLIWRSSRGIELTPAGELLLRHAYQILSQVESLKLDFRRGDAAAAGHIRVYANTTAVTEIMPEILARFLIEYPSVSVDLQEHSNRDVIRSVADGAADIGIAAGPVQVSGVEVLHFSTDKLVVAAPVGHPLTQHEHVTLEQVVSYPWIGMYAGSTLAGFLRSKLEQSGWDMHARIQLYSFESICRMVEAGVGLGVVPDSAVKRYARTMKVAIVPLNEPWVLRKRYVLVRSRELLPPCAQSLIDAIRQYEPGGVGD